MSAAPTPKQAAENLEPPKQRDWLREPERTPREIVLFLEYIRENEHSANVARQMLQVRLSEIAAITNERIKHLTVVLVILTVLLFFLTAYLSYEAYSQHQSHNKEQPHAGQQ